MRYCYALLICFASILTAHAQERAFTEYDYDQVGNTTSVTQDVSGAAPSIENFSPSIVRQNQVVQVTVNGNGLRGASISNSDGIFSFSNIQSSNQQITFSLTVEGSAQQGPSQISLSTSLGSVFFSLNVLPELPELRISPTPITILPNTVQTLLVSLSRADVLDHDISVSVDDESIATVNVPQVNIATGQIKPNQTIVLTSLANGSTRINFQSESLGNFSYNVRVTEDVFSVIPGESNNFISQNVGVNKLFTAPPPDLIQAGPFLAEQRVIRQIAPEAEFRNEISFSDSVGLLKGVFLSVIRPNAIAQGTSNTLTISGIGLNNVTDVTVIPDDNLSLGAINIAADGQSISLPIDVDAGTRFSQRQIVLSQGNQVIQPATPQSDRFWVGGATPTVNSVSPIFFNRNDAARIVVRGANLESVTGFRFEPNDGIIFSEPTIAQNGQILSFELQIAQFASIGSRELILESSFNDSQAVNVDASTIIIQDRPPRTISPVVSPIVGINRLSTSQTIDQNITSLSRPIGITRGATLTNISPRNRSQGSSFTLNLEGVNLDSVVNVEFLPNQGITVGAFSASTDGATATLQLDIANDAQPTTRQLRLSDGASFISVLNSQNRFDVTLPQPQIESVSPLQIARGQTSANLLIRGQLLNGASQLSFIPSDGITVGSLTPSIGGSSVSATISISKPQV